MIRVNPRQASLRAPEITSFQILTPREGGQGQGRRPERTRASKGSPEIAKGPAEDQHGLQPRLPPLPGGQSQRAAAQGDSLCPTPRLFRLGARESPGTTAPPQVPSSAPGCSALSTCSSLSQALKPCPCSPSAFPPGSLSPVLPAALPRRPPAPRHPPDLRQELAVPRALLRSPRTSPALSPSPTPSLRAADAGWERNGSYQQRDRGCDRRPRLLIINSWYRFSFFLSDTPSLQQGHLDRPSEFSSTINRPLMRQAEQRGRGCRGRGAGGHCPGLPGHGVQAVAGWAPRATVGPGAACGCLPLLWLPVWREAGGCRLPPRDP